MEHKGRLYIVATPIGNLGDISARAVELLQQVAIVACEDTRHSRKLLNHLGIKVPLVSLHDHNEDQQADVLIQQMIEGEEVALISDAGTPLISDPGYRLVAKAHEQDIEVITVPGCCAAIAALSASGLASDRFYFEGFLPPKSAARIERLKQLALVPNTLIFYESCHRIMDSLAAMMEVFGEARQACVAKELTKAHEAVKRGTVRKLLEWLSSDDKLQKGEFVILIAGFEGDVDQTNQSLHHILTCLLKELPLKQAVKLAVQVTGENKNYVYDLALKLRQA